MRIVDVQVRYENRAYVASGYEDLNGMRFSIDGEGATWEALKTDVREVVSAIYYDTRRPDRITLHLSHEENPVLG